MTLSPRMPAALILLMGGLALAYQVYQLNVFRMDVRQVWPDGVTVKDALKKPEKGSSQIAAMNALSKANLMGQAQVNKPAQVNNAPVVDTKLKLDLLGTIRGGPRDSALIRSSGKETKRYYVGDQVEGGAILDAVEEDAVILKRGAALETLRYSKVREFSPEPAVQPNRNANINRANQNQNQNQNQNNAANTAANNSNDPAENRRLSLRERLKQKRQQGGQ